MKYGDLVTPSIMNKLMAYSFRRGGVDVSIYRFSKSMEEVFGFLDSQRIKAINRYAEVSESGEILYRSESEKLQCSNEIVGVLDGNVEIPINRIDICEDDFESENHKKPTSKDLWISPIEMSAILRMAEAISKEHGNLSPD